MTHDRTAGQGPDSDAPHTDPSTSSHPTPHSPTDPGPELLAALDGSAFTRRHALIYGTAITGHFLDGFVINTTGVILPGAVAAFGLSSKQAGYLSSALFLGMLVGAAVTGVLSDRLGRRFPLACCLLVFAGFSVMAALAWDYPSLMAARACQGVGLGAEIAVVLPYITEFVPSRHRAPLVTAATAAWLIGLPVAALVGAAVVPPLGWRAMFWIGTAPVLVAAVMPAVLPESVRYLLRSGRTERARTVVTSLTGTTPTTATPTGAGTTPTAPTAHPATTHAPGSEHTPRDTPGSVLALLRGRYLRHTVALWFMELCAGAFLYGLSTWLPSVLEKKGIGLLGSLTYTAIITAAGVLGALLAGLTAKRAGRRPTIALGLLLSGGFCLWWGAADGTTTVVVLGCVATFFGSGIAGSTLFVYASELYPTVRRATGLGWAAAWQKVGGLVIPTVIGWVLALHSSSYLFFVLFAVVSALAGTAGLLAVFETRGRTIEQIADAMAPPSPSAPAPGRPPRTARAPEPPVLAPKFTAPYDQESGR
ncbi:MFS transporter [Streptomyces sp. NPDC050560]|uniref:MFS transporter n=1 Tax=Streptomyces sp. NPDC050560 TaxID=3365630 RepID=UPI00379D03BB